MSTLGEVALHVTAHYADNDFEEGGLDKVRSLIVQAIEADRAQRQNPVVVIREGIGYADDEQVDMIDLDFLSPDSITTHGDYDQEDIDWMIATLERGGLHGAAADVREWWAER